jgi:hypothetical protein
MNLMQDHSLDVSDEATIVRLVWQVEVSRENLIVDTVLCLFGHSFMIGIGLYLIELGTGALIFVVLAALCFLVSIATLVEAWCCSRTEFIELSPELLIVSKCFPFDVLALQETNTQEYLSTLPWTRRRWNYPAKSIKEFRTDSVDDCFRVVCKFNNDSEVELLKTKNLVNANALASMLCKHIQ